MSYKDALAEGGIAVVTGAASGVGLASAIRFAEAGLGVVLADLEGEALTAAHARVQALAAPGKPVLAVPTDVTQPDDLTRLADQAFDAGRVAVLMNNAGITLSTGAWSDPEAWRRLIEVNFWGVVNGIQAFVPRMVAAGGPAVVVNTGSKQGITTPPGNPAYNVSKAAVKVVTEQLAHELREAGVPISAHLFVPGFTYTGMIASFLPEKPDAAWTSEETVDYFLTHMAAGDFYILCPDNDVDAARDKRRATWALGDIIENRPALSRWHPDFKDRFAEFDRD